MNKEYKYAIIGFVLGVLITIVFTLHSSDSDQLTKIIPVKDISVDNFINNSNNSANLRGL